LKLYIRVFIVRPRTFQTTLYVYTQAVAEITSRGPTVTRYLLPSYFQTSQQGPTLTENSHRPPQAHLRLFRRKRGEFTTPTAAQRVGTAHRTSP